MDELINNQIIDEFLPYTRDDGTIEMRHRDYNKIVLERSSAPERYLVISQEELDQYELSRYQHQRAQEYPPIEDYLDGVVKGDQAQIDNYIAACLAVKAKYPKPE